MDQVSVTEGKGARLATRCKQPAVQTVGKRGKVQDYAVLVRDAKKYHHELVRDEWQHKMSLGKIMHLLETHYGDKSTAKFVEDADIDIAVCTLERWRSVYRAWFVDISAPGPISISYSVARALQTHPNRLEIITKNPKITKREAEALMEELGQDHNEASEEEPDEEEASEAPKPKKQHTAKEEPPTWTHEHVERWQRELVERANKCIADFAGGTPLAEDHNEVLRDTIEPDLLLVLRKAGDAWLKLADQLEQVLKEPS